MSNTKTLPYQGTRDIERSTISFPAGLWKRARRLSLELGVPANRFVIEGLELRLAQLEKIEKKKAKDAA